MSDLISREVATAVFKKHQSHMAHLWDYEQDMNAIPSTDIMECARAIKEYCRDRRYCDECRYNNEETNSCRLHDAIPSEWDLPEGEKE